MFLILLVSSFLLIATFFTKKHFRQLQLSGKVNGPPGLPLIGNGLELINKTPIGLLQEISHKMCDIS